MVAGSAQVSLAAAEKAAPKPKQAAAAKDEAAIPSSLSGKVVETMNSGGYTYVCLEKAGKKTWVAVPQMPVSVGQEMAFQPGNEMPNFTSKSLNRTFESIIFSAGPAESGKKSALPAGHSAAGKTSPGAKPSASVKNVKVEKATGPDSYTVGEIFAKRAELNKKTAVVRGTVVKASEGIMGMNWLHLQDGTGDAKNATHDLVVTTDGIAKVGDVVTVKGTVAKDKDFTSGYKYDVIIEKASIQP
jgi:hypothetical protein